jgi:hypothetical protein
MKHLEIYLFHYRNAAETTAPTEMHFIKKMTPTEKKCTLQGIFCV